MNKITAEIIRKLKPGFILLLLVFSILFIIMISGRMFDSLLEHYLFSYETRSGKRISPSDPGFNEISKILFPGYNVGSIVRKTGLKLREKNEYSEPTLLLSDNSLLSVRAPTKLLLYLLRNDPPEILALGSSRGRDAFRPDIFSEELTGITGRRFRALNLCLSETPPEIIETLAQYITTHFKRRFQLIIVFVDEVALSSGNISHIKHINTTIQLYRNLFANSLSESSPILIPALHMILDSVDKITSNKLFNIPSNIRKRYEKFERTVTSSKRGMRFQNWKINKSKLLAYRSALSLFREVAKHVVVIKLPVTDVFSDVTKNTNSIPTFQEETIKAGIRFDLFTAKDLNLDYRDFYYAKGHPEFDKEHINPVAAIRVSKILARTCSTLLLDN